MRRLLILLASSICASTAADKIAWQQGTLVSIQAENRPGHTYRHTLYAYTVKASDFTYVFTHDLGSQAFFTEGIPVRFGFQGKRLVVITEKGKKHWLMGVFKRSPTRRE